MFPWQSGPQAGSSTLEMANMSFTKIKPTWEVLDLKFHFPNQNCHGGFISSYLISGYDNIDQSRFWVLKDGLWLQLKVHYGNLWLPWGLLSLTHANLDIQLAASPALSSHFCWLRVWKMGPSPKPPPKKSGLKFHGESTHPWTSDPEMSSEQKKKRLALGPPRFRPTDPAPEIPPHMPGVGWDPKIILDLGNLYPLVN